MNKSSCPCLSRLSYDQCCGVFHKKLAAPPTAEALMRSRYCAFVTNQAQYLVDTLAAQFRQPDDLLQIQKTIDDTNWLGLKIINSEKGQTKDLSGKVEFVAFFENNGIQQLHENSNFEKIKNQWFYLDGKQLGPIKIGRNDPCVCGSEKKFKKCHG